MLAKKAKSKHENTIVSDKVGSRPQRGRITAKNKIVVIAIVPVTAIP